MGRYCGEDYDRSDPVRFECNRDIFCPEGHWVGRCIRAIGGGPGGWHYGLECLVPHPQHDYKNACELKVRADEKHLAEIKAATILLRAEGYSVRKLASKRVIEKY